MQCGDEFVFRQQLGVEAMTKDRTGAIESRQIDRWRYICARFPGLINLLSPTRACPVCLILDSPFSVRARSVVPVCRPLSDHSVSPWRMMKTLGVVMVCCDCDL